MQRIVSLRKQVRNHVNVFVERMEKDAPLLNDFEEKAGHAFRRILSISNIALWGTYCFLFVLLDMFSVLTSVTVLILLAASLWLNHRWLYHVSRYLLAGVYCVVLANIYYHNIYHHHLHVGWGLIIAGAACISVLFVSSRQMVPTLFVLGANAFYIVYFIAANRVGLKNDALHVQSASLTMFLLAAAGGLVFLAMLQLQKVIHDYFDKINEIHQTVTSQNQALNELNQHLDRTIRERTHEINEQLQESALQKEELESQKEELDAIVDELNKRNQYLDAVVFELKQRNFELDQIIYRLSHNLRGPVTSIAGLLNLMRLDKEQRVVPDFLQRIDQQILAIDGVLGSLNAFAEVMVSDVQPEEIDLPLLLRGAIEGLSHLEGYRCVNFRINSALPAGHTIFSDQHKLRTLFRCLASNAITFRRETGEVSFLHVTLTLQGKYLAIDFCDNGTGIDDFVKDKIFDMFYRGSHLSKGAGLGLYIAKEVVRRLEGTITLKSHANGTTVHVLLPA
ncbi:sensor histidine kinase [Dawidia soli]|uniref:histidine kinase n=1 Tax=Dawidia soli TaxID=2782352 RepID=A0AAP2DEP1_9BACT|nr:HAMP domain-containing sensor histidine kinase [Dawidia soli]MBT1690324.1 HAMP domain-containing histidine kinase [Dawidia soli]